MVDKVLKQKIMDISSMDDMKEIIELVNYKIKQLRVMAVMEFCIGDNVFFINKGRKISGRVTKTNQKTVSVDCGLNGNWRVSPTSLKKV